MIIVKIHYGLGNQLFQYALARRLSIEKKVPFKLDVTFFSTSRPEGESTREYQLKAFNIEENFAEESEIKKFINPSFVRRRYNQLERIFIPFHLRSVINEESKDFDHRVLKCRGNVYLRGYWQQEDYFKDVQDYIKKDFTFKRPPDEHNRSILTDILNKETSVCIHVRRGDYLHDPYVAKNIQQAGLEYYYKAVTYMAEQIPNPTFYVFSDDPEWVKNNLIVKHKINYIDSYNEKMPYEDLRLMSACKHFIIANSSFSWWAAWLGNDEKKTVIGPKSWFKNGVDVLPPSWVRI